VVERASRAKVQVLKLGFDSCGPRFAHCPAQLEAYLRRVRQLANTDDRKLSYQELKELLGTPEEGFSWTEAFGNRRRVSYMAPEGKVLWRSAASRCSMDGETVPLLPTLRIASTGRTEMLDGGRWAEVLPLWAPEVPSVLCQKGWVLIADWAGKFLEEAPIVEDDDEQTLDGAEDRELNEDEGEDVIEDDERREMAAIAASAARSYRLDRLDRSS